MVGGFSGPLPNTKDVLGERERNCGDCDPGRREVLLLLACPGLVSFALSGLSGGSSGLVPLHVSKTAQPL